MTGAQRVAYCGQLIESMKQMQQRPGSRELTSLQLRDRANRRRDMATTLNLSGLSVAPEYRNGNE